jgi:sigma-B regulation protein RsbU (phosphoserine phosphatase)
MGHAPRRRQPLLESLGLALLTGLTGFLLATGLEGLLFRVLARAPRELEWVSDAILTLTLSGALLLWLRLRSSRAELGRLEREKVALDTQLAVAATIQRSYLPPLPERAAGCLWAARVEPAGVIGGDLYDFLPLDDDGVVLLVADISGKGVPAALLLAWTRTVFRLVAKETDDPATILGRLSSELFGQNGGIPYLTCIVARVDRRAERILVANAGHPDGLLLGRSELRRLKASGPPAGLFPAASYTTESLNLAAGDIGLLFSDGITDGIPESADAGALLAEQLRGLGASPAPQRVCDTIMRFAGRAPVGQGIAPPDDRTVVAFRVEGSSQGRTPG